MDTPTLRRALRDDDPVAACWLSLADPAAAELVAGADAGIDAVVLDVEHGSLSLDDVDEFARAVDAGAASRGRGADRVATLVRLPETDPAAARRALDGGADGLLLPMVKDAETVEAVVDAARYPPAGSRGVGAGRATRYGLDLDADHVASAPDPVVIPQVETEAAVGNAAKIAAVGGVDALFVGPVDLSASLGEFGAWDEETVQRAVDRAAEAADAAGVGTGTVAVGRAEIDRWVDRGFGFVAVGVDTLFVADGLDRATDAFADAVERREGNESESGRSDADGEGA